GGPAVATLFINPDNSNILYAGTSSIFKSTDGGASWSPANTGLPAQASAGVFAVYPGPPTTLYAFSISSDTSVVQIYTSTDHAATWMLSQIPTTPSRQMLLIATAPPTLYAWGFTTNGLFALSLPLQMTCLWGFFLTEDAWESRLFLANLDTEQAHT